MVGAVLRVSLAIVAGLGALAAGVSLAGWVIGQVGISLKESEDASKREREKKEKDSEEKGLTPRIVRIEHAVENMGKGVENLADTLKQQRRHHN